MNSQIKTNGRLMPTNNPQMFLDEDGCLYIVTHVTHPEDGRVEYSLIKLSEPITKL